MAKPAAVVERAKASAYGEYGRSLGPQKVFGRCLTVGEAYKHTSFRICRLTVSILAGQPPIGEARARLIDFPAVIIIIIIIHH